MSADEEIGGLDVAIVGLAGRFPGARNVEEFWRNLCHGVESVTFFSDEELAAAGIPESDLRDPNYVKANAVLDGVADFDAAFFDFTPREAEITDPQHRLFLECAWEALEDAGCDSQTYPGMIGVYAGVERNTYVYNLYSRPEILRSVGIYQSVLASDKDYLATRVSYKLNLTGPSVVIQTACSTALVAVHMACQGLLAGDCDVALSGAVSVTLPQVRGYLHADGGIYSPDGHCRAFDERARGTLGGNGLGVVVLKRLGDALADADRVYAVIKGTAINNDGGMKVGYTAPSVAGQAQVIQAAQTLAGIDPETITYVEAHGTGTPLGDPIEVQALNQAFASTNGARNACALGSVKTNIGHLSTAAGIAGLIKTTLCLDRRLIPPSLHFESPNPRLELDQGPFYVNTALRPWTAPGGSRRAGVSSFGIGGTNAHVVLEEAPERPASGTSRPWHLIVTSARSASGLETVTCNLADHLEANGDSDLADVAFTCQVGRRRLPHRRFAVCSDVPDALDVLRGGDPPRLATGCREELDREVAFLFPGQGSQYVDMGRELYAEERVFRREIDRCAELLAPHLKEDLREALFLGGGPSREAAEERLRETALAQSSLFAFEYALARLWMDWGIAPRAMAGHSIGEYVAACLAGVFTLEDALPLVAARGRLMQGMSRGGMMAVEIAEDALAVFMPEGLSLAAVNVPGQCVVSGPEEPLADLESELRARGVETRRLRTSHAFHSAAMDPVSEPFASVLGEIVLCPPKIPFLSNLTGTWIRPAEATDPSYWVRHLRSTVRFSDNLEVLLSDSDRILLEVGPGRTLSTLARRHPGHSGRAAVLSSVRPGRHPGSDVAFLIQALGRLWLEGANVDWLAFHADESRHKVPLPTYPFERQRYWIEARRSVAVRDTEGDDAGAGEGAGPRAGVNASTEAVSRRSDVATPYLAPRGQIEREVAEVWEELLGVRPVGVHDDFFELGGHSLLATRLGERLREKTGAQVALRELLEAPTVSAMAALVGSLTPDSRGIPAGTAAWLPELVPDPDRRHLPFPLTDVQQAYWLGRGGDFELGNVATHIYVELDSHDLSVERLERAWQRLIERHDMLRAVVQPDGRQRILAAVPRFRVGILDLRRASEEARSAALDALRRSMSHQILPADRWPLFDVRASLLDHGRVRVHVSFDLLIGDAWSWDLLLSEMRLFYREPEARRPPLEISFRDYILAEESFKESSRYLAARDYWRRRVPDLAPAPDLPLAKSLSAVKRPRFVRRRGTVAAASWQRLKGRGSRLGLTPSGLVLAAFAEVLATWSRSPRFTLNLTLFHRLELHPQVNELIGDFTSLVLLEIDTAWPEPFEARARRIQNQLWDDLDHRYFSGVQVLRDLGRQGRGRGARAAMPIVFTSTLTMTDTRAGSEVSSQDRGATPQQGAGTVEFGISQTPQVYLDHQVAERQGALVFNWDVVDELFPPGMIDDMFGAFCGLLERLADSDEAWRETHVPLVPEAQLASRVIDTAAAPPGDELLHALFESRAREDPARDAVITPRLTLSFGSLAKRSEELSRRLRRRGARPNRLVAVVMEKGWEQVVAVLGALKAGAAYLPVDPALPAERRRALLELGEVELAVTQPWLDETLEWPETVSRVTVDEEEPEPAADTRPEPVEIGPDHLAYVIFTSGSTGTPKGVMIDHRGAVNTILDVNRRFDVGAGDRVLALSSLSFDLSVYDVFGLLAAGGAVVMPEPGAARDPAAWAALIRRHGVTLWNSVPALLEMLVEHAAGRPDVDLSSLRLALLSGDWIPVQLPDAVREIVAGLEVISLGGATEASIWSVLYPIAAVVPSWTSIPYGRPMTKQTISVLDHRLEPRPTWVPGDLFIGGAGLAHGYWRNEETTRKSFLSHPRSGERLYRTGDVGRYLPTGDVEFLGREDFQVKIQGHRIELGEIEAALARHPAVQSAVASAVGGERFNRRLGAWVVPQPGTEIDGEELRRHLRAILPEYMVPGSIVLLSQLPLTANGKVDRQALPLPGDAETPSAGEAAPTPVEELVAGVWSQTLHLDGCGLHQDFFELGGDSLAAIRVLARIREIFGVDVVLRDLFEAPTVAGLAARVERSKRAGRALEVPPLRRVARSDRLPLSFAQHRLWFLDQLQGASHAYNVVSALRIEGELRPAALTAALTEVVRRHEALRTGFHAAGGEPFARVAPSAAFPLSVVDLGALPTDLGERQAARLAVDHARLPFDLRRPPLLRVRLVRLADDQSLVLLSIHHVVSDAWSVGLLFTELTALYGAALRGEPSPLPELAIQYADYAAWQRRWLQGDTLRSLLAYWRARLDGAPALLELPVDRPRGTAAGTASGGRAMRFSEPHVQALRRLCRRRGATLFMGVLALFKALLSRYTSSTDVSVGTAVAGRGSVETQPLIGFFVNTLVLRTVFDGTLSFEELVDRVRRVTLDAYAHEEVPFEKLVEELQPERDLTHTPLFQVMVVQQNNPRRLEQQASGTRFNALPPGGGVASRFDLTLRLSEAAGAMDATLEYRRELFDATTIHRLSRHLAHLLGDALEGGRPLSRLAFLGRGERHQTLFEWGQPAPASPRRDGLHDLVERQAESTPDAVAAIVGTNALSYAELLRRADRLACRLRRLGVRREVRVACCCERSPELAVAQLGILKAGGAFVSLDPSHPAARHSRVLYEALAGPGPRLVVTSAQLCPRVPEAPGRILIDPRGRPHGRGEPVAAAVRAGADGGTDAADLAFVYHTSGSTGAPKGVMASHRAAVSYLVSLIRRCRLGPRDTVLQVAAASFDASVRDVLGPLAAGARVVFPERAALGDPAAQLADLVRHKASAVLSAVPTLLRTWLLAPPPGSGAALRLLLLSGEPLLPSDVVRARQLFGAELEVVNQYGPTEATMTSTYHLLPRTVGASDRGVPLGRPIPGRRLVLLDRGGQPAPLGVAGQVELAGDGLARGYLSRPGLTAAAFVPDAFAGVPGQRLYQTGDLARYTARGELELLGRLDAQLKLRGFRVEPEEIEAALRRQPGVQEAAVVPRTEASGDRRLVAFVVPAGASGPDLARLRRDLARELPEHMTPAAVVELARLPRTTSGKLDRRALARIEPPRPPAPAQARAPRDLFELQLTRIWESLLGVCPIGARESFFDLGGHSLLAVRLVAALRGWFGRQIPLRVLFQEPTIAHLAAVLRQTETPGESLLVPIREEGERAPLFCVHPASGMALAFLELANHLPAEQPVHAFQARGLDGKHEPCRDLSEMARSYLEAVREVQPRGPYRLAGWSMGGRVAYEMARQLDAAGENVALLALFDSVCSLSQEALSDQELLAAFLGRDLGLAGEELEGSSVDEIAERLIQRAQDSGELARDVDMAQIRAYFEVFKANLNASRAYRPPPYPGPVTLFRARERPAEAAADLGWGEVVGGGVEVHDVGGEHASMLLRPHVEEVARRLAALLDGLDRSDERAPRGGAGERGAARTFSETSTT